MRSGWQSLAAKYNINIRINGIPALSSLVFLNKNHLKYKTLIAQEMLLKGYLAGTLFYPSIAHSDEIINTYISELDYVFHKISECEKGNIRIKDILEVPVVHSGFKRLN